jgi:hypothetical protein
VNQTIQGTQEFIPRSLAEVGVYNVEVMVATNDTLGDLGFLVDDFDAAEVQIVQWPQQGRRSVFVALLAPAGDDIKPADFKAYYFDGSKGIHINAGIWHQPLFPVGDSQIFKDKQGAVHACVACNFVEEFGVYFKVPLTLNDQ